MDEPFGALDEITRQTMQDEILRLQKELKLTIVFITHDIREAMKLGGRMLVMEQGKVRQLDTPEQIRQNPADAFVRELVKGFQTAELFEREPRKNPAIPDTMYQEEKPRKKGA